MSEAERLTGYTRYQLLKDLAANDLTPTELVDKYGKAPSTIEGFRRRNQLLIEAMREDAADQYAGLWSAAKEYRIAEYQQDVEDINAYIERAVAAGEELNDKMLARKHNALKMIAEELGQLPQRVQQAPSQHEVVYRIEGVNHEEAL